MEQLFNIQSTDLGRSISDFTHKLGYQGLVDDARTVLEKLTVIERESTSPDGGSMLIRLLPYRTQDKRIDGVVISFVDITEVKNAERTRQNYESFYTLFHGSPVPTMLTRQEDNVIMNVNLAFLNYLNVGRDALIGHTVQELHLGLDMESSEPLDDNDIRTYEQEIVFPSGENRSILASKQRLFIQNTDAVLYSFIDITERVQADHEIHRLNIERKTIEHKERQRLAQLLHDDLQQLLFAAKIQLITLNATLQNGEIPTTGIDLLKPAEWLGEAISLTRQLSIDLSPLDLREGGLTFAILSLSSQMKDRYSLEVEVIENDFDLKFDDALQITLFQTVRELLFNIVKHSGILKATVTLERVDQDWAHIIVSDDGKGFDPHIVLSQKRRGRGLRSIQQDLKLFGCQLEADSTEQKGARMIINIPLKFSGSGS